MRNNTSYKIKKIEEFLLERFDIRYNTITNLVETRTKQDVLFSPVNEKSIYRAIHHVGIRATIQEIGIILGSDFVPQFNPIEDYFSRIAHYWSDRRDGDYIWVLSKYVKVKDQSRFFRHLKKWMVRAVACALLPSYYNKSAIVLVGEKQDTGKSSYVRFLCPPILADYMAENISTDKDSLIAICENFIINMDELSTLSKMEINALKSVFSKDRVKVRLPYEKRATTLERVASFIGSTNKSQFLNDETGSVRFINFEVESIDWAYREKVNIDLAWSQAFQLWKSDFDCELTPDEQNENETINNNYKIVTPEMELIATHLSPATKEHHQFFYTTTEILEYLVAKTDRRINLNIINLGKALKMAGFKQEQRKDMKKQSFPIKGYYIFLNSSYYPTTENSSS